MEVQKTKFLVTGGSRGIGRAIATELHVRGARLVLVGRDQSTLTDAARQLGPSVETFCCDLGDPEAVDRLIATCRENHPDLGGLINNAAIQNEMDLLGGDPEQTAAGAQDEIAINLGAVIRLCIGLLPVLRNREHAIIANITTGLAFAPKEASPVYCATKAGCHAFTQTLRYQCQRSASNVGVLEAIMPLVDTEMTKGRGYGKISAAQAARVVVTAIESGRSEAWIGMAGLLRVLRHAAPGLANRMLRGNGAGAGA